ncbi:hypothetical protein CEXT_543891 [Caerostris extrusa]|uniref:Transmembrane protein n=1 Tax=Caerostris extrusa TaxID=172846 RepID=A0AAV4Y6F4_CAEEX|nr:hypothetical protein CEXT_543891 [Caerostris extrusa]
MCSILYHPASEVCRQKTDAFVKVRGKKNLEGWGCAAKNSVGKGVGVVRILSFSFSFFFLVLLLSSPWIGLDWIYFRYGRSEIRLWNAWRRSLRFARVAMRS